MPQFKTLQFPNTPAGQAQKNRALEREVAQGWRVVSETIVPGKFKGGKACCLFMICTPCAFLAGYSDDIISVTLQRGRPDDPPLVAEKVIVGPTFDRAKWNALLQYDNDVAAAADQVKPLGSKWVDELAASYMVLNEPRYLPQIVERILTRVREEEAEQKRIELEREEKRRADEVQVETNRRAEEQEKERQRQQRQETYALWHDRLWGSATKRTVAIVVALLLLALLWCAIALLGHVLTTSEEQTAAVNRLLKN